VVVRDKDVPDLGERNPRKHELPRDTVAAIHDVRRVTGDDDFRRRRAGLPRPWAAGRAEED
jgi:hypothetical protein